MELRTERKAVSRSRGADRQRAAAPDGCDCDCAALLMLLRCMLILTRPWLEFELEVGWLSRSSRQSAAVSGLAETRERDRRPLCPDCRLCWTRSWGWLEV